MSVNACHAVFFSPLAILELDMRNAMKLINDAYEAFAKGDYGALLALIPARIDWRLTGPASAPNAIVCRTPEDVRQYFEELFSTESVPCFRADDFIDMTEQVVVIGYFGSTDKATGKPFESEWVHIFMVKDGQATYWSEFFASSIPTALSALRLPNPASSPRYDAA